MHALTAFLASGAPGHGEAAPGDHLQTGYRLWLAGHQLEHGQQPWVDPYSFHPEAEQANPAWWPYGLPYWPLVRIFGPVLAWNVFTLVCLFGAGALALLWLRELGLSRFAAAAGGLVYEIAPYRLVQSRGHLLGPISLLLPLALWAFERARKTGDQRWWWASRAALVSIPLSGQVHLALGAIPFYVLYGICRSREARVVFETVLGAVAAVLAGVLIDRTVINGSIDEGGRSLKEVNVYSATGIDFVSRHVGGNAEAFVFLGWLTPLLAIGGFILLARRDRWLASGLGIGAVVPILLAFGTHNPLYGPLWHAFPPLRYPRVPERLMPIACLAMAAFVAFAIDWGLKRREARQLPRSRWRRSSPSCCSPTSTSAPSAPRPPTARTRPTTPCATPRRDVSSSCPSSSRTSTTEASTSTTTSACSASGRSATRRPRRSAPTSSRGTSSR